MYCSVLSTMASATIVAHSSAPQQFHSTSSTTKLSHHNNIASTTKAIAHYTKNATLHTLFHQSNNSGRFSNYSQSLGITTESVSEEHQIPYGTFIQPFGSTIVVDSHSFRILAHSENAGDMLGIAPETFALGTTDVRSLLTHSSAQLLQKAFTEREISLTNPILIHSRTSGKPFHGILHRIDAGIVIDLEPAIAGANQSQKLSELLSLPGGDVKLLCNTVVESVREMTGYDRVMVYKFHEDDHGEVVAESKRPDLEPYIGLHYPATDIPEASRVSFMQNRVSRMIVDCHASPVRMVQDETLVQQPLCLVGSTLRAPHGCHVQYMANMGSIATLVMAVIVNENGIGDDESCKKKLWGLVICHHGSPKCVPFPLRSACESLVQAFGVRLNMEKRVLRTQSPWFTFPVEDGILGELSQRIGESSANLCFR